MLSLKRLEGKMGMDLLYKGSDLRKSIVKVVLGGLCSIKTWTYLLPSKKYFISIPFHALIAGIMVFLSSQMLSRSDTKATVGAYIPGKDITVNLPIKLALQ